MNCKQEVSKIVEFIKETVKDAGAEGVVLGLSGGIDSAVVYKLCVKALGVDNTLVIYMPETDITIPNSMKMLTVDNEMYTEPIQFLTDIITDSGEVDKLTEGNVKARLRMVNLYCHANLWGNKLVVGTTNKSEHLIGYFTKHGDGGVDFEPIQHLYKTEVYELAKYLKVPQEIIDKKPSADLWEGQTDEDEIGMSYDKLDRILQYLQSDIPEGVDLTKLEDGFMNGITVEDVKRVNGMILSSEHKRRLPRCLESI